MFDQAKMVMQMRKLQKELARQQIEVSAGPDNAVVVTITGEQKIKSIKIDPQVVESGNVSDLEGWIETAVKEAINKSQQVAAEKMRPVMGKLGNLGL